jgi:hypothetical protein
VCTRANITIYQRTAELRTMGRSNKGRAVRDDPVEALILGVIGGLLGALLAGAISVVGLFGIDMPAPRARWVYLRLRRKRLRCGGLGAVSAAIGCLPLLSRCACRW